MDTEVFIMVAKTIASVAEKNNMIRKKGITSKDVEDNVDSYFHEGYLRVKF